MLHGRRSNCKGNKQIICCLDRMTVLSCEITIAVVHCKLLHDVLLHPFPPKKKQQQKNKKSVRSSPASRSGQSVPPVSWVRWAETGDSAEAPDRDTRHNDDLAAEGAGS